MRLVSVVIPTHNRAAHLPLAVGSALSQTYPRVEVVVVDDGSTDETSHILDRIVAEHPRVQRVRKEQSGGAPAARNAGAAAAKGEVIGFLDDDCVYHPDKVKRQLEALGPQAGVAYCQQIIQQVEGGWEVEGRAGAGINPLEGLLSIGTNTLLMEKALFHAVGGFDEGLPRLQDWELLLRLSRETRFSYVPEILVQGVMVRGGITLTQGPLKVAARRIMDRHAPGLSQREKSLLLFILGKFLLVDGMSGEARRYMGGAIKANPTSPKAWAGFAAALMGPGPARIIRHFRRDRRGTDTVERWAITPAHGVTPPSEEA